MTKYSPEIVKKICSLLEKDSYTIEEVCADICLPEGNRPSGEGTGSTPLAAGNRPAF